MNEEKKLFALGKKVKKSFKGLVKTMRPPFLRRRRGERRGAKKTTEKWPLERGCFLIYSTRPDDGIEIEAVVG